MLPGRLSRCCTRAVSVPVRSAAIAAAATSAGFRHSSASAACASSASLSASAVLGNRRALSVLPATLDAPYSQLKFERGRHVHRRQRTHHGLPSQRGATQGSPPRRSMFISVEPTPNPDSLKFVPEGSNVLGWASEGEGSQKGLMKTLDIPSVREAWRSPLARDLFAVEGVQAVFLGSDFITVTKTEFAEWVILQPQIFSHLTEFLQSGKPVVDPAAQQASDTAIQEDDDEVVVMIKELLETRVRPAVQADGGDIVYKGFEDGVVFLKMQGSCSGCPSSSVTLKQGIERMLMHWVPEVVAVVAIDEGDLEKINTEQFLKTEQQFER